MGWNTMKIMSGDNRISGLKDRRIVCMAETSTPPSIGLSDLVIALCPFIALRAMLVSKRSVGASEHRIHHAFPGLKDHPDTSIARSNAKGYVQARQLF